MTRPLLCLVCIAAIGACGDSTGPSPTAPTISSIGPNRAQPNAGPIQLYVNGSNFEDSAVVQWNGMDRFTIFLDSTQLVAFIPDEDVDSAGTFAIRVVNPNGERSAPVDFIVAENAVAFGVDSLVPPCCGDASAGVMVAVYFNEPLHVPSLGDSALVILNGLTPVAGTVSYDPATQSLRFSTPLTALRRYTVRVSDRFRSVSGGALPGPLVWNFTTARGAIVTLDTADFASLALGADGRPRIAYRWTDGVSFAMHLRLATCIGDCTRRTGWTRATIDDGGGTGKVGLYASLAAAPSGALHVAYQDFGNDAARFATVGTGATPVEEGGVGAFTSLAAGPSNRLHLTYFADGDLHSATCATACTTQANWALSTVDTVGNVGAFSSVAVDPGGTVHVAYFEADSGDLRYAACAGPCSPASWTVGRIDTVGRLGIGPALLATASALHVTYYDQTNGGVKYASCAASCEASTNWTSTVVASVAAPNTDVGFYTPSLALGPGGQLEVAFADLANGTYARATCAAACSGAGAWTVETLSLQAPGNFRLTSLRVDGTGSHVTWTDAAGGLKYMKY